ncbi:MAG TPA: hypothetical protein ENK35_10095 [Candidatus Tenderia sp.]|nr:hypothetical protein [Candidatus Tenderia sp.]
MQAENNNKKEGVRFPVHLDKHSKNNNKNENKNNKNPVGELTPHSGVFYFMASASCDFPVTAKTP